MNTEKECLCCTEIATVSQFVADSGARCITDVEEFKMICLDPLVLKLAITAMLETGSLPGGVPSEPIPNRYAHLFNHNTITATDASFSAYRSYRYAAYKQFTYYSHHKLGKKVRKVVPACAVKAIRTQFPEPNNIYVGFKDVVGLPV